MKNHLLFLISLCLVTTIKAQNEGITGARAYGVAGNAILFTDLWSIQNNPAGLGQLTSWQAGISYENQFLINELSNKTVAFSLPVSAGSFGLSLNQFGSSLYNESRIGLAYGQKLSDIFSMGIQLNYLSVNIGEGYGSASAISGNIGLLAELSQDIRLAFVVVNPNRAKIIEIPDERFPTLIKLGVGYKISKKVQLLSEIAKDIDYESNIKVGIEYKALELLYFRLGYASNPALSTFGFGLNIQKFKLDFASGFDSNFGFSPQISLRYLPQILKNNEK